MLQLKLLSALEKVFPCQAPDACEYTADSCLRGERFYFQAAVYNDSAENYRITVTADSPLKGATHLYAVKHVPCTFPAYPARKDENYLNTEPGLFPDLLWPLDGGLTVPGGQWRCLWVEVDTADFSGPCPIVLGLDDRRLCFDLTVLPVTLPGQQLLNTQWFHCDCLATQYDVPVFSPEHWTLIDRYMENAAAYGTNMILTPVVTPPLDTEVGGERPTVQLVQITLANGGYGFDFALLDRYIALAQKHGITHFEIAHPFTQWGAGFAPKILVRENGEVRRRFGWDTPADAPDYVDFLSAFLPALKQHLKDLGVFENCFFHVSDEPEEQHLESYSKALAVVAPYYADCQVIDALSEYRFTPKGWCAHLWWPPTISRPF